MVGVGAGCAGEDLGELACGGDGACVDEGGLGKQKLAAQLHELRVIRTSASYRYRNHGFDGRLTRETCPSECVEDPVGGLKLCAWMLI